MLLLSFSVPALAEAVPDVSGIQEFAAEYGAEIDVREIAESAMRGEASLAEKIWEWMKARSIAPLKEGLSKAGGLLAPLVLLALLRCALPDKQGAGGGARFLLRMVLLLGFGDVAVLALEAAGEGLRLTKALADAVAPAVAALLTAMGMAGSAALVSPAAALAGNLAEDCFLRFGLPLCRCALCTAIVGNLSGAIRLNRITALLRKAANWGTGLATTFFTALLALQGSVSSAADGLAARTAKYAVDSAAPVIGSGVSDAWESYISGVLVAKNALGVSGVAALLAAGLQPVLRCIGAMLALNLIAAFLDALGESETAKAAGEVGGVCQMALSLCTGALAVAMVLLGAAMAAGRNLAR